jgi:hypothetical protein
MNQVRGRPFEPGNKQGRGRPKGSRNKTVSPARALLNEYALPLTRTCIGQAMQGDPSAMRLCMQHIYPPLQDRSIRMGLSGIRSAADLDKAAENVTHAVGRGKITPTEGGRVMSILAGRSRIIETAQLDRRLSNLEERLETSDLPLAA